MVNYDYQISNIRSAMILLYVEVSSIMTEDLNVHFNRDIRQIHFTLQKHFTPRSRSLRCLDMNTNRVEVSRSEL